MREPSDCFAADPLDSGWCRTVASRTCEIEASDLSVEHLRATPVWEWAPERPGVDTNIRPVRRQTAITERAGICAVNLTFANGHS